MLGLSGAFGEAQTGGPWQITQAGGTLMAPGCGVWVWGCVCGLYGPFLERQAAISSYSMHLAMATD